MGSYDVYDLNSIQYYEHPSLIRTGQSTGAKLFGLGVERLGQQLSYGLIRLYDLEGTIFYELG